MGIVVRGIVGVGLRAGKFMGVVVGALVVDVFGLRERILVVCGGKKKCASQNRPRAIKTLLINQYPLFSTIFLKLNTSCALD